VQKTEYDHQHPSEGKVSINEIQSRRS